MHILPELERTRDGYCIIETGRSEVRAHHNGNSAYCTRVVYIIKSRRNANNNILRAARICSARGRTGSRLLLRTRRVYYIYIGVRQRPISCVHFTRMNNARCKYCNKIYMLFSLHNVCSSCTIPFGFHAYITLFFYTIYYKHFTCVTGASIGRRVARSVTPARRVLFNIIQRLRFVTANRLLPSGRSKPVCVYTVLRVTYRYPYRT